MSHLRPDSIDRLYWTPKELADKLNCGTQDLRFWESELSIPVRRNKYGDRRYSEKDVATFSMVATLTKILYMSAIKSALKNGTGTYILSLLK